MIEFFSSLRIGKSRVFTWRCKQAGCGWLKSWHLMMCNLSALLNEFLPNIDWHVHNHSWLVSHHCIETSTICVPSLYFRGTLTNDQQMACTSFGSLGQPQFYNAQCNITQQFKLKCLCYVGIFRKQWKILLIATKGTLKVVIWPSDN